MISRRTSCVPNEDVVSPRLIYSVLKCSQASRRCSQTCHFCSQVLPGMSSALTFLSLAHPGALRCTWRPLCQSSQLWDLTTQRFWSDNSPTLPEAPRGSQRLPEAPRGSQRHKYILLMEYAWKFTWRRLECSLGSIQQSSVGVCYQMQWGAFSKT